MSTVDGQRFAKAMEITMAQKNYKSRSAELKEVISFTITDETGAEHLFVCKPFVPVGSVLKLMRAGGDPNASEEEKKKNGGKALDAMLNFIRKALMKSDVDRFFNLLDSEDLNFEVEDLGEIVGDLAEAYTGGRPTGEQSSDTQTSPSTGGGSTGGSSPQAPTYSRSPQTEPSI